MNSVGSPVKAVLFDRDGTLVHDVPCNGDPERVRPVDGAREAVALLREHGVRVGVVTNQSGVARGLISDGDVRRVNRRIDDLIGPFDVWAVCPHGPDDGCHCRKPQPGMILWAAGRVCTGPADCVVIGDIGADLEAAERAGAHGILVPNDRTRPQETAAAAHVAPDLLTAVRALLNGPPRGRVLANERPIEGAYGAGGPERGPRPAPADRSAPEEAASATAPGPGVFAPRDTGHRSPPGAAGRPPTQPPDPGRDDHDRAHGDGHDRLTATATARRTAPVGNVPRRGRARGNRERTRVPEGGPPPNAAGRGLTGTRAVVGRSALPAEAGRRSRTPPLTPGRAGNPDR
ncbi:HAD-IIIA family hydrolase [Streptomyces violaceorubidus]